MNDIPIDHLTIILKYFNYKELLKFNRYRIFDYLLNLNFLICLLDMDEKKDLLSRNCCHFPRLLIQNNNFESIFGALSKELSKELIYEY